MKDIIIVRPERCTGCNACVRVCPAPEANITKKLDNGQIITTVNVDKCIGCGRCAKGCPADCITRTDYTAPGHKLASMQIDPAKCVKCGTCMSACKFNAIEKR